MEKIYRDEDVDLSVLAGKTIAVIGYGIQGKVQAANARDSGLYGHRRDAAYRAEPVAGAGAGRRVSPPWAWPRRARRRTSCSSSWPIPAQPAAYKSRHRPQSASRADSLFLPRLQRALRRHTAAAET